MANEVYYVHGILLPSGTLLSQLTDITPDTNSDLLTGRSAGWPYPLFRGIREQNPEFAFTSEQIGTILAAIVAGGNNYALDLSAGNTDLMCRQGQDLAIRYSAAASQHERLRMARAILAWETISAAHKGDATIACRLVGTYDGVNAAVTQVGTGTLTGTPASDEHYTLGPVKIGSSWLGVPQNMSIASGIEWERAGGGNDPAPRYTGVRQTDEIITLTTLGKPWGGYGLSGGVISSMSVFLCRKEPDAHNYADATAVHIKLAITNGIILPQSGTGGGNNPMESTLRVAVRAASGSAAVLTITTGVAIA